MSQNVRAVIGDSGQYAKVVRIANAPQLAAELALMVGGGSGARRYSHPQPTPEKIWKIAHSLGNKTPEVFLIGDDGHRMFAPANYKMATLNYIEIEFFAPTSGIAIITA